MAKSKEKGKSKSAGQKGKAPPKKPDIVQARRPPKGNGGIQHRLDEAAQNWKKLLRDPCNADLVRPCYEGTTTGYLVRTSLFQPIPGNSVDGIMELTPSYQNTSQMLRYGYSTTYGGSLGTAAAGNYPQFLANSNCGRYRAVAGCARVHYIGTELNRSGTIGLNLAAGPSLNVGETINVTAPQYLPVCAAKSRTFDGPLEVRWLPNHSDGQFTPNTTDSEEPGPPPTMGNTLQVVWTNVPAGYINVEFVFVWEWQPASEFNTGLNNTVASPASRNHLNEILSTLGDASRFAVGKIAKVAPYVLEQAVMML